MEAAFQIFLGRWSSQALAAAISTGIIDAISEGADSVEKIAQKTGTDPNLGRRLVRAMYGLGILTETTEGKYSLTPSGEVFTSSHPQSLKNAMLWEHCEELVHAWTFLPQAIQTGKQSLMAQVMGVSDPWEALGSNSRLNTLFNNAMTSYSKNDNPLILSSYDWENSGIEKLVDIGGGQGYLVSSIVNKALKITGYVYELAETLNDPKALSAPELNVSNRVHYIAGDMFTGKDLISADAYIMKHVLHDWDDENCIKILKVAQKAAKDNAKLFIAEMVLPEPGEKADPFGFLLDLHMMIVCSGKERTLTDYSKLFEASGWKLVTMHKTPGPLQLIEAVKVK